MIQLRPIRIFALSILCLTGVGVAMPAAWGQADVPKFGIVNPPPAPPAYTKRKQPYVMVDRRAETRFTRLKDSLRKLEEKRKAEEAEFKATGKRRIPPTDDNINTQTIGKVGGIGGIVSEEAKPKGVAIKSKGKPAPAPAKGKKAAAKPAPEPEIDYNPIGSVGGIGKVGQ